MYQDESKGKVIKGLIVRFCKELRVRFFFFVVLCVWFSSGLIRHILAHAHARTHSNRTYTSEESGLSTFAHLSAQKRLVLTTALCRERLDSELVKESAVSEGDAKAEVVAQVLTRVRTAARYIIR